MSALVGRVLNIEKELKRNQKAALSVAGSGKDGKNGLNGKDGKNGLNGKDGKNGIGVVDAKVIGGELLLGMSSGDVFNAGRNGS